MSEVIEVRLQQTVEALQRVAAALEERNSIAIASSPDRVVECVWNIANLNDRHPLTTIVTFATFDGAKRYVREQLKVLKALHLWSKQYDAWAMTDGLGTVVLGPFHIRTSDVSL